MDNEQRLIEIFAKVKNQDQSSSFQETKALFLASQDLTIEATKTKQFTLKKLLIMIGIVGLMASVAIYVGTYEEAPIVKTKDIQTYKEIGVKHEPIIDETLVEISGNQDQYIVEIKNEIIEEMDVLEQIPSPIGFEIPMYAPRREPKTDLNINLNRFVFPTLTKKEVQETNKQKGKMLKALAKNDGKTYQYIPSGSFTYKSKVVSVQSFIMQKAEVSNLEYRTFLFDLLIQGRKAEFKMAAPSQEKWTELFGEKRRKMQNEYFSDSKFDNYPVCNVSPEGAEMYCKWLTLELDKSGYKKKMKMRLNDVRIPQRVEWVKAASNEGNNLPYPWSSDTIHAFANKAIGKHGVYLANFTIPKSDSTSYVVNASKGTTTLGSLFGKGMITINASFARKYDEGLYNICGNVAELVHETNIGSSDLIMNNNKTYGTAGGGWMNSAEEIKILNESLHKEIKEGHPNVGFRVVMTYIGKGVPLVGVKGNTK